MNELPPGLRATLEDWLPRGLTWEELRQSGDLVADWQDLGRSGAQRLLRHQSGAVVALRFEADRLASSLVMEGRKADEQLSSFGFACPQVAREELDEALLAGVEDGLDRRYGPQRRGVEHLGTELLPAGEQRRRYRLHAEGGGVLEVLVGLDGRPLSTAWLSGPRARAAVEQARRISPPPGPPGEAQTWGEALLRVEACGAELEVISERPGGRSGEVWLRGRGADGPVGWRLRIADRVDLRRSWLGPGPSRLIDAAFLVRVGQRALGAAAAPWEVECAVAALSAVLALISPEQRRVPAEAFLTEAGREIARREPVLFTRRWLRGAIEALGRGA